MDGEVDGHGNNPQCRDRDKADPRCSQSPGGLISMCLAIVEDGGSSELPPLCQKSSGYLTELVV